MRVAPPRAHGRAVESVIGRASLFDCARPESRLSGNPLDPVYVSFARRGGPRICPTPADTASLLSLWCKGRRSVTPKPVRG